MDQRTYRVPSPRAPRLLFELSRIGQREDSTDEREAYRVADALVSMDHVEPLAWSCVIAAADPATIESVARRLGLEPGGPEPIVRAIARQRRRVWRIALSLIAGLAVTILVDVGSGVIVTGLLLLAEWALGDRPPPRTESQSS